MLTFKDNRIEIVRGLLSPLFLDTVQRLTMQSVWALVKNPPDFFKPDPQCEKRYPLGRQYLTEAVMYSATPVVSRIVGRELVPTYSFPVVYFPGAELIRHVDRPACEVTATLTIMNQPNTIWPIFVEDSSGKPYSVDLNPGDMVVYDGIRYPHWREPQDPGHFNISVFFHFVSIGGEHEDWHKRELRSKESFSFLYDPLPLAALFPDK